KKTRVTLVVSPDQVAPDTARRLTDAIRRYCLARIAENKNEMISLRWQGPAERRSLPRGLPVQLHARRGIERLARASEAGSRRRLPDCRLGRPFPPDRATHLRLVAFQSANPPVPEPDGHGAHRQSGNTLAGLAWRPDGPKAPRLAQ